MKNFYPRPPGGGRHNRCSVVRESLHFYPRPPGGGRLSHLIGYNGAITISIHALRVEGDLSAHAGFTRFALFLSTPSGWRATSIYEVWAKTYSISIHALRVEGDSPIPCFQGRQKRFLSTPSGWRATKAFLIDSVEEYGISIHALRVEGDHQHSTRIRPRCNFYPRPPGGGRPRIFCVVTALF